jgi:hypothetical protein
LARAKEPSARIQGVGNTGVGIALAQAENAPPPIGLTLTVGVDTASNFLLLLLW